jgi:hypothetical protein
MACCCGDPIQTCSGCVSMPERLAVSITSSAGDALAAVGATFGQTSYTLAYTEGFYWPAPCRGASQVCGSGAGALLESARWDGGSDARITLGGQSSYCAPTNPHQLNQAVLVCSRNNLTFFWSVGNPGTSIVPGCESSVYAMPTGIDSLRFNIRSFTCTPFSAVLRGLFNGVTFTATITEYVNPLP